MKKKRILVTAGPTYEFIDPVRFISNCSTGVMGYRLAQEAYHRGYEVILISGPVDINPFKGIKFISVISAKEMFAQVKRYFPSVDCLIMSAAVADFSPYISLKRKIKKTWRKEYTLRLKRTADILRWAGRHKEERILIGFSLETEDIERYAYEKLKKKNLDLLVVNLCGKESFGDKEVEFYLMDAYGKREYLPRAKKEVLSKSIFERIEGLCNKSGGINGNSE